jgi:serine/threonine protein kinase
VVVVGIVLTDDAGVRYRLGEQRPELGRIVPSTLALGLGAGLQSSAVELSLDGLSSATPQWAPASPSDPTALVGVGLGPFLIESFIGAGSYAQVWKGVHRDTNVPVAIKIAAGSLGAHSREDFTRELTTLVALRHPNIVHVYDAGTVDRMAERASGGLVAEGTPFVVMEYASRGTLLNLRRPFTWHDFVRMSVQLLDGLAHAHARGVLHRDIKPANVLLGSTSDLRSHIKLADFGVAFSLRGAPDPANPAGEYEDYILGTPLYMAPEQFRGAWRDYGPATDLYSFGAVAWELLTGAAPFNGTTVPELAMQHRLEPLPPFEPLLDVPPGALPWLETLLSKDALHRFQFARHAAQSLVTLERDRARPGSAPGVRLPSLGEIATSAYLRNDPMPPALALGLLGVRPGPVVGRDPEMTRVCTAIDTLLLRRQHGLVVVRGASGVGVTQVGLRVVEALHEAGRALTLPVDCDGHTSIDAALRAAIRTLLRVDGLPAERVKERLVAIRDASAGPFDLHALVAWLDGAHDPDATIFADWVVRLGNRVPVILWIDSSGHGAPVSRLLLSVLERSITADRPAVVLMTDTSIRMLDPVIRRRWSELGHVHDEVLHPLSHSDLRDILDATIPLDSDLRDHLADMSIGMPGRANLALHRWLDEGRLEVRGGRIDLREIAD